MVGAMDSPTIRQLRHEWRALGSGSASGTARHLLAGSEPVIARLNVLLAHAITQVLIPGILAGYEDDLHERVFPCFPVDLFMRCSWIACDPTEIETPT
jgi:hypothetical protein